LRQQLIVAADAPPAIGTDAEQLREMEDRLAARDEAIELLQEQAAGLHAAVEESALAEGELRRDVERRRSLERFRVRRQLALPNSCGRT
jgi:hypothetical protein